MSETESKAIIEMIEKLVDEGCSVTILRHRAEEDGNGEMRFPYVVSVDYDGCIKKAFGKSFLLIEAMSDAYTQVPEVGE